MIKLEKVPANWALTTLQEVADINPTLDKSSYADDLEVSFVPMPAVEPETGRINVNQIRKFGEVKKGYTPFQKDDVLFAKITPCMENGKMALVPDLQNEIGFGSTEFHVLRAHDGVNPRFLYYFVSSKAFRYDAEHNMTGAVGQKRVPTTYIKEHTIYLPPTNEQRRIVGKIEQLFEKMEEGERYLQAVTPIANDALGLAYKLRQSILIHAFSGKLVAQDPTDEPATVLLERIHSEKETQTAKKKPKEKRKAA